MLIIAVVWYVAVRMLSVERGAVEMMSCFYATANTPGKQQTGAASSRHDGWRNASERLS